MTAAVAAQEAPQWAPTARRPRPAPNARHGTVYVARACGYRCPRCAELRHGRPGRYDAGCRCQACLAAHDGERRLPFAALEELIAGTTVDVARAVGVDRRQVLRFRARLLQVHEADRLAIAAGFHPTEVWGDDWTSGVVGGRAVPIGSREDHRTKVPQPSGLVG